MQTVNKAYHVLKQEGYISLDKRRGAVIAVDVDKLQQLEAMKEQLRIVLGARALQEYLTAGGSWAGR